MFSVDNFYDIFNSHHGWDKTQTLVWRFQYHGSKNLEDLVPIIDNARYKAQESLFQASRSIILHDQEPFSLDSISTYQNVRVAQRIYPMWEKLSLAELMQMFPPLYGHCVPIIAHSEQHSKDINELVQWGIVECYYFWHGLISRDWFRHWRFHGDISSDKTYQQRFLLYARDRTGTRQYRNRVVDRLTDLRHHVRHNWDGVDIVGSDHSAKIDVQDACQTAIHLVAETVFDQDKIHVTEKVFKPMVMKQPFVIFSGAGTLQYLRSYGFRTFDTLWDESYDHESDHDQRLEKVISIVRKLCDLPESEFHSIMHRARDIVEHNHQHFFSEAFQNIMLEELHKNVSSAIDIQKRLSQEDPGNGLYKILDNIVKSGIEIPPRAFKRLFLTTRGLRLYYPDLHQCVTQKYPWVTDIV